MPRFLRPLLLALTLAAPLSARARSDAPTIALTPAALGDALSCRSAEAAQAFASALFLDTTPPTWMRKAKGDKATKGMIGLYGYTLRDPVDLLGQKVDRVYFLKDWVLALLPRAQAEAFVTAQRLKRAPIAITRQYYRFIDPESGPMLGAFEPTGDMVAAMLAGAFGEKAPPPPPADRLFVGCNYMPASEADFLDAARQSAALVDQATRDVTEAVRQ